MRSIFVVVATPRLQIFASIFQRQEPVSVQALGAQLGALCLDERIVGGLTRAGEVQGHTAPVIPTRIDQNSCAHCRMPMDMMRHG